MNKCIYCGSENLKQVKLKSFGDVLIAPVLASGHSKTFGNASLWGYLCTDCGSITRVYIKEKDLKKYQK